MTQTGVTGTEAGTIPAGEGNKTPEPEGKTPVDQNKVSPEDEPKYSEKQTQSLVNAAKSEMGRTLKEVEKERDSLKTKLETKENELSVIGTEIEDLQKKLDDMSSDDPARFDVVKELKAAREERKQLRTEKATLKTEKDTLEEDKKEVAKWKRDQLVFTVADEYVTADGEAVDFNSFMTAADKFELSSRETLTALAETLGFKLKTQPGTEQPKAPKPYSGKTDGGFSESLEELMKVKTKNLTYQERLEHQKKLNEARKQLTK
jgi:DNA gyrase/topoisomerase IV subunit A